MESTPATLKTSEKTRKYHFFPRKSKFVFLKNSTLLTVPSKHRSIVVSRWSFGLHQSFRLCERQPTQRLTTALNAQRLATLLPAQHPIKNHPRHKHRRKQVRRQPKYQRSRKSLDRPCSKQEQNRGRNDGRDVRINDGDPGMAEALFYSR